jgi:hypothetical protein
MTNSQIIYITEIGRCDIVNDTYKLNLSDEQMHALVDTACIAVIGGNACEYLNHDSQSFSSLRLFKSTLSAEKYIVELLRKKSGYTYVQVQIQDTEQKMGKINNAIINAGLECEDSYADIVIDFLSDATSTLDLNELYKQEIETIKYITNSDLNYSSALLYINSELYIDTDKCCVYWYGIGDLAYKKAIPSTLKDKVDYLNELAKKAYSRMARYHLNAQYA